MAKVKIVTDSTGDVPAALARELEISIVPCQVIFGNQVYRDQIDLSPEEFYAKSAQSEELPRTSQPLMRDFVDTYQRLLNREPEAEIVSIHVAARYSGTVNGAWAAAQTLPEPTIVEVIDSGTVSMGMGWPVIEAARTAKTGATRDEVAQYVQGLLPRSKTAAMIDTLDNLRKGGRINHIAALLGTALQIKPLLNLHGGEIDVWGRVRTRKRALKRLVAEVQSWGSLAEMAVLHANAEALARELAEALGEVVPAERVLFTPAGPALTAHLGLGAVGVCGLIAPDGQSRETG